MSKDIEVVNDYCDQPPAPLIVAEEFTRWSFYRTIINPAVAFGQFLARKVSFVRAILYMVAQCLGAICGCALVKSFQKAHYDTFGGGANYVADGYRSSTGHAHRSSEPSFSFTLSSVPLTPRGMPKIPMSL